MDVMSEWITTKMWFSVYFGKVFAADVSSLWDLIFFHVNSFKAYTIFKGYMILKV